jgi:regulator of replication initiation timing
MAGTAYFGEGMKILNWLKSVITLPKRFAELQRQHDDRLMLNRRLSAENRELKTRLTRKGKPKTEHGMQRQLKQQGDAHSLQKAKQHVALMRREVLIRRLALLIDADQYFAISDEVEAMSDVEVLGYKKPKLVARNIQS